MRFTKTLSFSISLLLIVIVVGLLAILFYNNLYAMNVVRNQVVQSYRDLLPRYVEKQDDNLSDIQDHLVRSLNHSSENPELEAFGATTPQTDAYHFAANSLFLQLSRDYVSFDFADILFFYTQQNTSLVSFASMDARTIPGLEKELNTMVRAAGDAFQSSRWQLARIGTVPGLLCMSTDGEGNFMGAWVALHKLLSEENAQQTHSDRGMLLVSEDGDTFVATENLQNAQHIVELSKPRLAGATSLSQLSEPVLGYLLIAQKSSKCDVYFVEVIQEGSLLSELRFFQVTIYLLPVIMILAFFLYLAYLQRIVITPMHRLTHGMGVLGRGNMRVTLPESGADEMRYLIRSFNDMTAQLESLRIENYEKQLQAQRAELETKKAELRSMQLQINPHFFANSLNIIYSLSAIRDYQTIQKMALLLSRYFRYIMRSDEGIMDVRRELDFVRDYLDIQKLRFTKRLLFSIEADPQFDSCRIPPLTLQPFVENAIVHGFVDPAKPLEITVRVSRDTRQETVGCRILIQDNGKGFSPEQLDALAHPDFLQTGEIRHIGIWNVLSRLEMTFGAQAEFRAGNCTGGGASIELFLPCDNA